MSSKVVDCLTRVKVVIEGLPPGLLFGGKGLMIADYEEPPTKRRTPEEEAPFRAHWMNGEGEIPWDPKYKGKGRTLGIPTEMFYKSIVQAAMAFKQPDNKRSNMSFVLAPTLTFEPASIVSLGTDKYTCKKDFCRIPPKKGAMVLLGRPLVEEWSVAFTMVLDAELYRIEVVEDIVRHAGKLVGIAAWSPRLKGPYGRYVVKEYEVVA